LAKLALNEYYHTEFPLVTESVYSGPIVKQIHIADSKIVIEYSHTGSGLKIYSSRIRKHERNS
jgi:hypothetical protein